MKVGILQLLEGASITGRVVGILSSIETDTEENPATVAQLQEISNNHQQKAETIEEAKKRLIAELEQSVDVKNLTTE